jgi:predicted enzyme related to lactoylglutathione lyase
LHFAAFRTTMKRARAARTGSKGRRIMNVHGIDATYYVVSDIDAQTKFYTELFGAGPEQSWPGRLSEWTFHDGNSFGLYQTEGPVDERSGSVMFAVDDVAQTVAAAKARGVKFADDGAITDTPACEMAFGEDPEGNQFIIHHRKS